ncbi:MAG TPA: tRNA (adenosine(37)-N6)-threonylcarbamoyltransferase complex ATPase subunit type 1 TsaE [Ktedonobacterales bacterium]|nr:tRNA (adenosine(37)-N6)-threonylcarbamoyltransferase complex ATPase subunit type 1 TsaE [Ktedonobacterales bacterium]
MSQTNPEFAQGALISHSVAETQRLGALLGELLAPGDMILLQGDLGAGKTALTQGIARGMGVATTVNSPTFTILKEYVGRLPLYHFDLYRIESPDEVMALGFEDYFGGDGVSVVEWAVRGEPDDSTDVASPWPANWLRIHLTMRDPADPTGRELRCSAYGERGQGLLAAFLQAAHALREHDGTQQTRATQAKQAKQAKEERAHAAGD